MTVGELLTAFPWSIGTLEINVPDGVYKYKTVLEQSDISGTPLIPSDIARMEVNDCEVVTICKGQFGIFPGGLSIYTK